MFDAAEFTQWLIKLAVGKISVQQFEDWFVRSSWNATNWASANLRDAIYSMELTLAEYSNGHRSSSYIRALAGDIAHELETSLHPILPEQIGTRLLNEDLLRASVAASPLMAAA